MQRETKYAAVALGLSLTLLAAACGGADKPGTGGAATEKSTGSATTAATSAATSAAVPAASGTPNRKKRVVMIGTSLTAGLGLDPDRSFATLVQRKIDSAGFQISLVNAGLSGETSAGALRRAAWVLDQPADAVILEVGANDGLRGVNPDSTEANLVALIKQIHHDQPNAKVLLVQMEAPTNLGRDYQTRFHYAYQGAAEATGTPLLPFLLDGVAGVARLNQADGIHPNVEGSKRVAETLWKSLLPTFTELAR